jgi:DNA-binding transcriptional MerR regulator
MDEQYLIHEVAEKAGVSTRTIRYYITEGLLPAPSNRGRYASYDPAYIDLIRLIRQLKDSFLPLKEIKLLVHDISPERVQELLRSSETLRRLQQEVGFSADNAEETADDSAKGYINNVMQRRLVQRVSEEVVNYNRPPLLQEDKLLIDSPRITDADAFEKPAFIRKRSQAPGAAPVPMATKPEKISAEMKQYNHQEFKEDANLNTWQRYEIMEGVELNIRGDVEKQSSGKLADIIITIRQLFKLI